MSKEAKDIKAIFSEALEKQSTEERAVYLDKACGNDTKLRGRIEALLKAHAKAGSFLDIPSLGTNITMDSSPITEGPGTVIGRYKLLEQIGEGGFGVVYMADQTKPIVRRVALKIIKLGMDTKEVIARFEAERQALAMMEHPNIAKVLDAGATETGRPYFVMELVKGIPITEYCDKNNLDTQERLELLISVCKAVEHAHQKGIIHRDLKPSNVLITLHDGKPVPKVIDFGIAKATGQRLTEKTLFTRFARMIGTPEYMSPEQAEFSGLDIDSRSDIYSLGVLLYQLLTGVTPFDAQKLREAGYSEMQRIIREDEPDKPSTRLSIMGEALTNVAKHRKASPDLLQKLVRGDLDWIAMKTLEKDRTRRYERAAELAADVQRHLNNEPVLAVAPSIAYRLHKFVRRNRVAVITCSLITVALIIGATIATFTLVTSGRLTRIVEKPVQLDGGTSGQAEAKSAWTYPTLRDLMVPSPDGHYVVFRDAETGDLALRDLEAGINRQLTHNEVPYDGTADSACFSSDGKWVAYNWIYEEDAVKKNDLRIIGIDGSQPRIIHHHDEYVIEPYAWFPNGKQILGLLWRDRLKSQAVVISMADGSIREIEGLDRNYQRQLSLSPDGRYVAYTHWDNVSRDIALLPVNGGEEIPVIEHPADDRLMGWTPDGGMLVFRSNRRGEGYDAWGIQIIDGKPQGQPLCIKKNLDSADTEFGAGRFTQDGSFYYTAARPGRAVDTYIAKFDPETGKVARPRKASQRPEGETGHCQWSPDGKHLLYTTKFTRESMYNRGPKTLVVHSIQTGWEREISLPPESRMAISYAMPWSPDGRSILVMRMEAVSPLYCGLSRLDVDSGKITSVVPPSEGIKYPIGWSVNGKKVFFMCEQQDPNTRNFVNGCILEHNLETSQEKELYRSENSMGRVVLSPDRQQLAFTSGYRPAKALMVMPTAGGKPRELFRVQQGVIDPDVIAWTPDGCYVIFLKRPRGSLLSSWGELLQVPAELWRIPTEGGEPQMLEIDASVKSIATLRVHPDGKQFAFTRWEPYDQELWVLENFLPDLSSTPNQLPNPPEGNYFVTCSEDDAEEKVTGAMHLGSYELDMGDDKSATILPTCVVGIRFTDIRIPKGSQIKRAYVQFAIDEFARGPSEPANLTIWAELSGNAEKFTEVQHNISSRRRTKASAKWSPEAWTVPGERTEKQRTPDLSALIQEVIAQDGWQEGNALVLIITGSGTRIAASFDYDVPKYAPMLHIEH